MVSVDTDAQRERRCGAWTERSEDSVKAETGIVVVVGGTERRCGVWMGVQLQQGARNGLVGDVAGGSGLCRGGELVAGRAVDHGGESLVGVCLVGLREELLEQLERERSSGQAQGGVDAGEAGESDARDLESGDEQIGGCLDEDAGPGADVIVGDAL